MADITTGLTLAYCGFEDETLLVARSDGAVFTSQTHTDQGVLLQLTLDGAPGHLVRGGFDGDTGLVGFFPGLAQAVAAMLTYQAGSN